MIHQLGIISSNWNGTTLFLKPLFGSIGIVSSTLIIALNHAYTIRFWPTKFLPRHSIYLDVVSWNIAESRAELKIEPLLNCTVYVLSTAPLPQVDWQSVLYEYTC